MTHPSSLRLHDYLDSSSLDPLATSIGDENVDPHSFAQSSPIRLPRSSPPKAMRVVEDFSFSSPHGANRRKSNAPNSSSRKVSYQNLSPWRIRVTVEAEPEEMGIPNGRTTTRTTKVPLREDSPSTEFVQGRGRRSQAGLSATKRRSTPVRGARSSSRSRRQSVTDLDLTVLGDEEDLNEWSPQKSKKKGRPRSKKSKREQEHQAVRDDAPNSRAGDGPGVEEGRNVSEDPGFEIRPDSDAEGHGQGGGEMEENSPELRKIDLNKVSVRSRSRPPKDHKSRHKTEDNNNNTSPPAIQLPPLVLETGDTDSRTTASFYPTPTSSVQDDFDDVQNLTIDPTEHHEGFDTILESEGFTMIDLESIPSARHFVSPPSEQNREKAGQVETPAAKSNNGTSPSSPPPSTSLPPISSLAGQTQLRSRPTAIPSYLTLPEGESDLSSTIPSSPPVLAQAISASLSNSVHPQTKLTPVPYSSPRLPSPPRASTGHFRPQVAQHQKSTPPKLARVVKAGIALQGVLSPKISSEKPQVKSPRLARGTPKERLDDLFEGFDSGTRRELRAGLRFGEELAKRQKTSSPVEIEKKSTKASSSTRVWRGETTVQHTLIGLPASTSDMVEKRACLASTTTSTEVKRVKGIDSTSLAGLTTPVQAKSQVANSPYLDTQAKEREWQLEREAVSRQIQNANTSQVIVIDSDGIDEDADRSNAGERLSQCTEEDEIDGKDVDETDGDIWLAEAEAHSSSQYQTDGPSPDFFPTPERERQRERAREVVNKPRRSLIPSPWRRGEDIDGASTFMTNGDVSGLLWKQPTSGVRFGAGAIKRQRQGTSDAFGSGSQGTPVRLRENSDDANPLPAPTERGSILTEDQALEQHHLGGDDIKFDEIVPEEQGRSGDDLESENLVEDSICETEDDEKNDISVGDFHAGDTSALDASSLPPQPIKIPVNFNDSTLSAPPLTPAFQSITPQSSRPSTPRSALKGSRLSLGLEENSGRKVVFSKQSRCVDESGQTSNSRIKSLSPTPPPSSIPGVVDLLQPALPPPTLSRGIPESEPEPAQSTWFGWLWGSSKPSVLILAPQPIPTTENPARAVANVDGAGDDAASGWKATTSSIVAYRKHDSKILPSFLRPPSYPSDPSRDVSIPLATSGKFTDVHFRTLHIIYRKSLRRSFHAPDAIRPRLQEMVGEKLTCDEGEYGYFAWEVDQDAVIVLERFMLEVELGWEGKGNVEWSWSEKELCGRLFRIIVGEEVRREQSFRREQDKEQKKNTPVGCTG
jgi:hypothetical protein